MLVKNKYLDVKSPTFVYLNVQCQTSPVGISWCSHVYADTDWHDVIKMMSLVITCQDGVLQVVPVPMLRKISQVFGWKFQLSCFHCVLKLALERAGQLRILTKRLHFYHDQGSPDSSPLSLSNLDNITCKPLEFHLFIRSLGRRVSTALGGFGLGFTTTASR